MHPGWFARNCELMTLRQFSRVMNSRRSLGPPLTIRPARWVGLSSRLKAPLRSIKNQICPSAGHKWEQLTVRLNEMDCDALKRFNTAMASEAILCRDGVRRVETESSALATD